MGRKECSVKCEVWRKQWEVRSVKCGVWSVCEVWSVKCEVWSLECEGSAVWSVKCEVWSVKWSVKEVWSAKSAVWSVKCEVWSVECEVWSLECEECSVKCGVWSLKFGVRRVQCEVWSVCEDFASSLAEKIKRLSREGHGRDRLSLNYRSFMFGKLPPPACPGLCMLRSARLKRFSQLCFFFCKYVEADNSCAGVQLILGSLLGMMRDLTPHLQGFLDNEPC